MEGISGALSGAEITMNLQVRGEETLTFSHSERKLQ